MQPEDEIRKVFHKFQEGYSARDVGRLDAFMDLFGADFEIIGTAAVVPEDAEWHLTRESARMLFENDWLDWGNVLLDVDHARIRVHGDIAWLSTSGTVSIYLRETNTYANFLDHILEILGDHDLSPEARLYEILRGGTNTVYEARRGEDYVWPLRFTALLIKEDEQWRFYQMQFSYPTTRFPDVRLGV
jgi:hypothetical protein